MKSPVNRNIRGDLTRKILKKIYLYNYPIIEHYSKIITNTTTRCTTTTASNKIQEGDGLKLHKINR